MEFIKKNKTLLILLFLSILCLVLSTGHCANLLIDVGRELYTPVEILDGKILYKDIFCIYGPASYLLNAFIYKIFGIKTYAILGMGAISALSIIYLVYKISRKFLSELCSFSIAFYTIMTACLATRIFNFTLPYSYAMLYGLLCFLISIYFIIKYKEDEKLKYLYTASLFAGFSISNKYDFVLFILPLVFIIFKTKNIKTILTSLALCLFGIIFPFFVLFIQGLKISDLINALITIKSFTLTESLKTFYVTQGVYYTNRVWFEWLCEILVLSVYFLFIHSGLYLFSRNKIVFKFFGILLFLFGMNLAFNNASDDSYLFMTFFVTALFVISFKKNTKLQNFFILSVILVSLKTLWALSHSNYGLYFAPCIFISLFIISSNLFSKLITNSLCFLLIGMSLGYGYSNYFDLKAMNFPVKSDKGILYTSKAMGAPINEVIEYLNNADEKNPSVMIFPEGQSINFLVNKKTKTNALYYSLIPLYTEGFGEEAIIKSYKENPMDYIVISNLTSESYGKGEICKTYGFNICEYFKNNYAEVFETKSGEYDKYIVLKRK